MGALVCGDCRIPVDAEGKLTTVHCDRNRHRPVPAYSGSVQHAYDRAVRVLADESAGNDDEHEALVDLVGALGGSR